MQIGPNLELSITHESVEAAVESTLIRVDAGHYDQLVAGAAKLMEDGRATALFVPGVSLVLDTALDLLNSDEVQHQLGNEVLERQVAAGTAVHEVLDYILEGRAIGERILPSGLVVPYSNPIIEIYERQPEIAAAMSPPDARPVRQILNRSWLELTSLINAPISDARITLGGAFKFLGETGILPRDRNQIIKRSHGLLAVSGIEALEVKQVAGLLGSVYINPQHFSLVEDSEAGAIVRFTERAKKVIAEYSIAAEGCPAGQLDDPQHPGNPLLLRYWGKLIDLLIPENATTDVQPDILAKIIELK